MNLKTLFMICMCFAAGVVATDYSKRYALFLDELDCGTYKAGWSTHVTYEHGEVICVYRQQQWPFRTHSGRNV
jgi:hypothetical protein